MASKDNAPAGLFANAQAAVVDAKTNVVNAATGFGKQAGAYAQSLKPDVPAKKEESKVGAAATNVVDGAKDFGSQAQKEVGSGAEKAGAGLEKLESDVPAKAEEMKKGAEKKGGNDDGVIGGLKKFAAGWTKGTEKKEDSTVGAAATNVVDGAKDYGDQAQKEVGLGAEKAGAGLEKLKSDVPAKAEEMKKSTEKKVESDDGVFGGLKKFAAGLTKGTEKKEDSTVGAAATDVVDGAKEYGNQAQKEVGSGAEKAGAGLEKLKSDGPAKVEEMKKSTEKKDGNDDGVIGGVKKFAAGLTKGTEKKEDSTVGAAATDVVDGAKEYGDQAQKEVGSGVGKAGAGLEKLKSDGPAEVEEMKKSTEKKVESDDGVFGGVKKFAAGLTK